MKIQTVVALSLVLIGTACSKDNATSGGASFPNDTAAILANYDRKIAGSWKLSSRTDEMSKTVQEFEKLQQKYPNLLSKFDATNVASAEVVVSTYHYTGATTCDVGDPRLTFVNGYYNICMTPTKTSPGKTETQCEVPLMMMPADRDPCWDPHVVIGSGYSCENAKENGREKCIALGYGTAGFQQVFPSGSECSQSNGEFLTQAYCENL